MYKTINIEGFMYLKSGLRIGGNKDTMQIGGIDSPVVKNPITNMPYIPGSSVKGKTRFLLEAFYNLIDENKRGSIPGIRDFNPAKNPDWTENKIAKMFGHLEHKPDAPTLPTRVIFRDSNIVGVMPAGVELKEENINRDIDSLIADMASNFSEAKVEVSIDRLSGTVGRSGPRTLERVPAGTVFDFSVSLRVFEEGEDTEFLTILKKGLQLVQNDALGGSGSRGYGRVDFFGLKQDGETIAL